MVLDPTTELPAGIRAAPLARAHAPALTELMAAIELVDDAGEHHDADDVRAELADPFRDLAEDTRGFWAGAELVAYGMVRGIPAATDVDRLRTMGGVHPDWRRRGLGRAVLAWQEQRAAVVHAAKNPNLPAEIHLAGPTTNTGLAALAAAAGYEPARYFVEMERDLLQLPLPQVPQLDGLRLVGFDPAYDEPTRIAHNEAFRDHWGFQRRDEAFWQTWMTGQRAFRPGLSFLFLDGEQVAAYVLGFEYEADTATSGVRECYIGLVGTRQKYRGRGCATALLARAFGAAREAGMARAGLGVDVANSTGALGLYEGLGFVATRHGVAYTRPL